MLLLHPRPDPRLRWSSWLLAGVPHRLEGRVGLPDEAEADEVHSLAISFLQSFVH
jgi:hypothetical protein